MRKLGLPALLVLLIAPIYLCLGWSSDFGELGHDGPAYLMMAEHYAGGGIAGPAHDFAASTSRFPPIYPMLLALGGGAVDIHRAHLLTAGCLLAALVVLYCYLRLQALSSVTSFGLVLLFALAPGSWLLELIIQSEYLYLFWSFLALALMTYGQKTSRTDLIYLSALVIAFAAMTRVVGFLLLVPLLMTLRRIPRPQALLALVIALAPILLWKLLHRSRLGYDQAVFDLYHGYGSSGILQQLPDQALALRTGFEENLIRQPMLRPLADVLGLVTLAATLVRLRQWRPDAAYLIAYAIVILLWPFPEEARRFVWVVLPLLLAQPLFLAREREIARNGFHSRRMVEMVALAAIGVMVIPAAVFAVNRWRDAQAENFVVARQFGSWYSYGGHDVLKQIQWDYALRQTMEAIPTATPENGCVLSVRPDLVTYFGRRLSIMPPIDAVPEPAFRDALKRTGCDYVFGLFGVNEVYPTPLYPLKRIEAYSEPLLLTSLPGDTPGAKDDIAALARLKLP